MRIAQVAPLFETVPPTAYGGTERVVAGLCGELVRRGHDVTLFAVGGSESDAEIVEVVPTPLRLNMSRQELIDIAPHLHMRMLVDVYSNADDFDLIHAHTDLWTFPFAVNSSTPTLVTMHGRLDIELVEKIAPKYPTVALASISDSQRQPLSGHSINWAGTAYNGLDLSSYSAPSSSGGEYLAFIGRITRDKRPDWAVEVARQADMPLKVAAKVDPLDIEYWTDEIRPLFRENDVEFIGEIGESEKPEFFADAAATLFPIDWPEPFGLVMIESLAAGTPVIALNKGAVPEILSHGRSGFICSDLEEMVEAVGQLGQIDREVCRTEANRFSAKSMVDRYLEIYQDLMEAEESTISLSRKRSLRGLANLRN